MESSQSCCEGEDKARTLSALSFISNLVILFMNQDSLSIKEETFASHGFGQDSKDNDNGGIMHYMCGDGPHGFLLLS